VRTVAELFVGILHTGLSGGMIILLILLLRFVFRKTPKALICFLWMIAILRLLLPFHIETNWSLQPSASMLTDRVQSFRMPAEERTESCDAQPTYQQMPTAADRGLDTEQLLGAVWSIGAALMAGWAVISYLRLRRRVAEATKVSEGVYCCPGADTAFLFGYFRPRIYLPETDDQTSGLMQLHEQAHLRRGDHWLMLAGYTALCLHWFNPLVWVAYILLSRDIEAACDEHVIRTLGVQARKNYANTLLASGKHRSFPASCPVAFGEISIKQRIIGVLNYRKPAAWVCILLLVITVGVGAFFLTSPVENPAYYMVLMDTLSNPLDEVCHRLGITKEELSGDGAGNYGTPIYVDYAGVTMQLCLHTSPGEEGEPLRFFSYTTTFEGDGTQADRAASAIAQRLYKTYGPGEIASLGANPNLYKTISAGEMAALLEAGQVSEHWDITDSGDGNLDDHIRYLQAERYQNNSSMGGKVCYLVRFHADYDAAQNVKKVTVVYRNYLSYTDEFGEPYATKLKPPQ